MRTTMGYGHEAKWVTLKWPEINHEGQSASTYGAIQGEVALTACGQVILSPIEAETVDCPSCLALPTQPDEEGEDA